MAPRPAAGGGMMAGRTMDSAYMQFAKLRTNAKYNLASSGIPDCSLADFTISMDQLALRGPGAYGDPPLLARIAARFGIPEACVVTVSGCSFANNLAFAGLVSPGDEVLVEDPTYELLLSTLEFYQARITRFARREEFGWRLDPDSVAAALTPRTRLVVLTNLHNPTGALADDAEIAAVAEAARRVGAMVLVDEVYRELMFHDGNAVTSFRPDSNIVVTSSLTKAYGLSGLRCGWILAPAPVAERLWRLNDLFAVHNPHVAECLSVVAFDTLEKFRARATAMLAPNRAAYFEILGSHPGLRQSCCAQGTTMFPALLQGDGDALYDMLMQDYETSVVPGRFFGKPNHIRIGLCADPMQTREALNRVATALTRAQPTNK
jgi:aspartate/methionine/tyrosine aminotransferase